MGVDFNACATRAADAGLADDCGMDKLCDLISLTIEDICFSHRLAIWALGSALATGALFATLVYLLIKVFCHSQQGLSNFIQGIRQHAVGGSQVLLFPLHHLGQGLPFAFIHNTVRRSAVILSVQFSK